MTIIYVAIITVLSTVDMSSSAESISIPHIDKVVHFCFYMAMNILLIMAFVLSRRSRSWGLMLVATCLTIFYSIVIEVVQIYVGRGFEVLDICANTLGSLVGLFVMRRVSLIVLNRAKKRG
ncbi:MAG: VanZ family protein [Rikenellaceae bacterium]